MKVKFNTEELKKRLGQLGKVISSKPAQPVYGYVRLFTTEQQVDGQIAPVYKAALVGVDIAASLTILLEKAVADGPVDVLINFDMLRKAVQPHTLAEIVADVADTSVTLTAGRSKQVIRTQQAEWPAAPERPTTAVTKLNLHVLQNALANVSFMLKETADGKVSVAKVNSNETQIDVVTTDGYGLVISTIPGNAGTWSFNLPKPAFDYVATLEGGSENKEVTVSKTDSGFFFDTATEFLMVMGVHGEFPNYSRVFPKEKNMQVTFDKATIVKAFAMVLPFASAEKACVTLAIENDGKELTISSTTVVSGAEGISYSLQESGEDIIDVTGTGTAVKITVEAANLKNFLERAYGSKTGIITLNLKDEKSITDFYANDGQYRFLQMPTKPATVAVPTA